MSWRVRSSMDSDPLLQDDGHDAAAELQDWRERAFSDGGFKVSPSNRALHLLPTDLKGTFWPLLQAAADAYGMPRAVYVRCVLAVHVSEVLGVPLEEVMRLAGGVKAVRDGSL